MRAEALAKFVLVEWRIDCAVLALGGNGQPAAGSAGEHGGVEPAGGTSRREQDLALPAKRDIWYVGAGAAAGADS